MMLMPNKADSKPEYKPVKPSRCTMRLTVSSKGDCARLDSTCALVDRVIKG